MRPAPHLKLLLVALLSLTLTLAGAAFAALLLERNGVRYFSRGWFVIVDNDESEPVPVRIDPASPPAFELVGVSSQEVIPGAEGLGVFEAAAICQADFGPGTRACTVQEVAATTRIPQLPEVTAYLMLPAPVGGGCIGPRSRPVLDPGLGLKLGLTVDLPAGRFGGQDACDVPRPIACCGPRPSQ